MIGDMMYVHTPFPNIVYALNLADEGKIVWKYEPKQDPDVIPVMCCDTVNRGVAYAEGKIFYDDENKKLTGVTTMFRCDPVAETTESQAVIPSSHHFCRLLCHCC